MSEAQKKLSLPAIDEPDDGFSGSNTEGDRLIIGDIIKCDVTKPQPWINRDDSPLDLGREWFVMSTRTALQLWQHGELIDTLVKQKGKPLPDLAELNAKIPQSTWDEGFDGKPKPPWQQQWFVHLLDPQTAERRTFVGNSIGAMRGVTELQDDVSWMRRLRVKAVSPIVTFGTKPMNTKYGIKPRPWFRVTRWIALNIDGGVAVENKTPPALPPTGEAEQPEAERPDGYPNDYAAAKGRASNKKPKLKEVERPTLVEELDDEIPY
jgi:hypothetical protein